MRKIIQDVYILLIELEISYSTRLGEMELLPWRGVICHVLSDADLFVG